MFDLISFWTSQFFKDQIFSGTQEYSGPKYFNPKAFLPKIQLNLNFDCDTSSPACFD